MISEADKDIIIDLMGKEAFNTSKSSVTFSYITNPDGSIRWLYPKSLKKPTFLSFYSTSSIRSKLLSYIIKSAFFVKQAHRISAGDISLNISQESKLGQVLDVYKSNSSGFSIFTGTVGQNRKAIIEMHDEKNIFAFVKIALTESAKRLVQNEAYVLRNLEQFSFHNVTVPKVLKLLSDDIIVLSNIHPKNSTQYASITPLHIQALNQLYTTDLKQKSIKTLPLLEECQQWTDILLKDFELINTLSKEQIHIIVDKVSFIISMLRKKDLIMQLSIFHGDFTPWNMYESNEKLYLLDWELSQENIPLLFDIFHFIFQSEIMIKKTEYAGVLKALKALVNMQDIKSIKKRYDIDLNVNYMLYLIYNILYYLQKYIQQPTLHQQVFWQIEAWNNALDDIIEKDGKVIYEQ